MPSAAANEIVSAITELMVAARRKVLGPLVCSIALLWLIAGHPGNSRPAGVRRRYAIARRQQPATPVPF
jgi:hypothetical protein